MLIGTNVEFWNAYRSIGIRKAERYGVGFMDKSNVRVDANQLAHPAYVMVLLLHGSGEYIDCYGEHHALSAGCCFQRFPGCIHTVLVDPDSHWQECFLEVGSRMYNLLESSMGMDRHHPVWDVTVTDGLVKRFLSLRTSFCRESDITLVHHLPEILDLAQTLHGRVNRQNTEELNALLEEACNYLSSDFQSPVDFPGFCRRHGIGYENFRKIFRQKLGVSPQGYRIRRRMDTACAMLNRTTMTIGDISRKLGYSSPYEFSAQFKRHIGCAPSAYAPRIKDVND